MPLRRIFPAVAAGALIVALVPLVNATAQAAATPAVGTKICGQARSVSTDADGDTHHVFAFADGSTSDEITAAPGLDPNTATPARLKKLGLPDRPAAAAESDRSAWNTLVQGRAAKQTVRAPCEIMGVTASLPAVFSDIWSGYEAHPAAGKKFRGAHASYTAPNAYHSTCTSESMAQWMGVANNSTLVQAGLYDSQAGWVGSGGFFEFAGGPWDTKGLMDLAVVYFAGDRYYFSVEYADASDWSITVEDLDYAANGWSGFYHRDGGGGTNYIGTTAAAISERLQYNGGKTTSQYMNHSTVSFRNTQAVIDGGGAARFSIENPQPVYMFSSASGALSGVGPLDASTSNFVENWAACGLVENR